MNISGNKTIILSGILVFSALLLRADSIGSVERLSVFIPGIRVHYGSVIKHSRKMKYMPDAFPVGFEALATWHFSNPRSFDLCNCYPRMGFMAGYWDFGLPDILGKGYYFIHFVEPVFGAHQRVSFSLRAGYGIGYLTNPYDPVENPDNLSYSSRLSFPLILVPGLYLRLNDRLLFNVSAGFNHVSNAGISEPNLGINFPAIGFGVDYSVTSHYFRRRTVSEWRKAEGRNRTDILISSGRKQLDHAETQRFFIFGLSVVHSRQTGRINALTGGLEWLMDGAIQEKIRRGNIKGTGNQPLSVLAGHEFLLGRFVFSQSVGVYLYKPFKYGDFMFQRYGLTVFANDRFHTGISFKAHRHVADHLDIRVCFTL